MKTGLRWTAVFCAIALSAAPAQADLGLEVATDRTSLSLDETLTLRVTVQSEGTESADVSVPDLDGFQIVSQQVQRPMQFSFSFGARAVVRSSTIYVFGLQPTRSGVLVIKPVRAELDGRVKTSAPIQITVSEPGGAPAQGSAPESSPQPESSASGQQTDSAQIDSVAFVRTVVDKDQPTEGEQITATIYLYMRERLQTAPEVVNEPTTDGLWVHDLLSPSRTLQPQRQIVNGTVYTVYVLRRFAAFPLRSGEVAIGGMSIKLDTTSFFDLFARGRQGQSLTRTGSPLRLNVKPLPADGKPDGKIAVGRFQLSAHLDRPQAATGDAITLIATVQGQGNLRTAELSMPALPNVDVLQPEIKDLIETPNDLVSGRREYRWLLVPRAPGRVVLEPLVLHTFDPRTQTYQTLRSGALSFDVVGQPLAAAPSADSQPESTSAEPAPETRHKWAPIRTQSALQRGYRPWVYAAWFPLAASAPGFAWLAVVVFAFARRQLGARTLSESARCLRDAEQRMQSASKAAGAGDALHFHADANAALLLVLQARLQENVSGLSRAQMKDLLVARRIDETLTGETLAALERSEFARFGSPNASASVLAAELATLRELLAKLRALPPAPMERAA